MSKIALSKSLSQALEMNWHDPNLGGESYPLERERKIKNRGSLLV
jgi:hypothetical protein